jgi:hypothetical protein
LGGFAMDLYRYDGANQLFVEINPGVPANFVTIQYEPNPSGYFAVTFGGQESPALSITSGGGLRCAEFTEIAPAATDVPRVEFLDGSGVVAAITQAGEFYAPSFTEGAAAGGVFNLFGGGELAVSIGATTTTLTPMEEGE